MSTIDTGAWLGIKVAVLGCDTSSISNPENGPIAVTATNCSFDPLLKA
jgi:hypothetical protein